MACIGRLGLSSMKLDDPLRHWRKYQINAIICFHKKTKLCLGMKVERKLSDFSTENENKMKI
jgi:hypothetical protein